MVAEYNQFWSFVRDFQWIIGTILGFAVVTATLWHKANEARDSEDRKLKSETMRVRNAILTEVETLKDSYNLSIIETENLKDRIPAYMQEGVLIEIRRRNFIFHSIKDKIGLLEKSEAKEVIWAYHAYEVYIGKLMLLGSRPERDELHGEFVHLPGDRIPKILITLRAAAKQADKAIAEVRSQIGPQNSSK